MRFIISIIVCLLLATILIPSFKIGADTIDYMIPAESMNEKDFEISDSYFIHNLGQMDIDEVQFYSRGGNVFFTPTGPYYRFRETETVSKEGPESDDSPYPTDGLLTGYREKGVVLKYTFIGANRVFPEGRVRCSFDTNFFIGNEPEGWIPEVPNYLEVVYPNLWDGIDLVYRIKDGAIKYDLILHPGADPERIAFEIEGHRSLSMSERGDLVIGTEYWDIIDGGLVASYAKRSDEMIPCSFSIMNNTCFGFEIGLYDTEEEVIIDPLIYSTYVGGTSDDQCYGCALDSSNNVYLTGQTASTNYPTSTGAYDTAQNGNLDVFVTKLNSNGTSVIFSTFIGGSDAECGRDIVLDDDGYIYITGETMDGVTDYPTTSGAYDTVQSGNRDVFVTKLSPSGSSLIYSTFVGGGALEFGWGIAVDADHNAYITGYSNSYFYPVTDGSFDTYSDGANAFITKLNESGSSIVFSTWIGSGSFSIGYGITLDTSNNVYLTGYTSCSFPTTKDAFDRTFNGNSDAFVLKLNSTGDYLIYSTLVGGGGYEVGLGIVLDSDNNAYVTGHTSSGDHPTTTGAFDTSLNGNYDVFALKLNHNASALLYSTFIGGATRDVGYGVALDQDNNLYVTGYTRSYNYPTTPGAYDETMNSYGVNDVFLSKISANGSQMLYSTFLGGSSTDYGKKVILDSYGSVILTGYTDSSNYPTTAGAYDTGRAGGSDVFVTKFKKDMTRPIFGVDSTNHTATTGDPFLFNISVTDDSGVSLAQVEYWFGGGGHTLLNHSGAGSYEGRIIIPWNSTETLSYRFYALDTSNNSAQTKVKNVEVLDNDPPCVNTSAIGSYSTTGETFNLNFSVVDNIELSGVFLEYRFGSGTHTNVSLGASGSYHYPIVMPENSTLSLSYVIGSLDSSDNWNRTLERNVIIYDNDQVEFGRDTSPRNCTTGDPFIFGIEVADNVAVFAVWVEYWFGAGPHQNGSMLGEGSYTYEMTIPWNSPRDLYYIFHANDTSDNSNQTYERIAKVSDNDRPIFNADPTPVSGTTGDPFIFSGNITDNIGVSSVWIEYWFGSGAHTNASMSKSQTYEITIPWNSTEDLYYLFHANDTSDNWNRSDLKAVLISDANLASFTYDSTPDSGTTGETFEFVIDLTDNIGVSGVWVEYWFGSGTHFNESMSGSGPYVHEITIPCNSMDTLYYMIHATDTSDNWNETGIRTVIVEDNDIPEFGSDETPGCCMTGGSLTFTIFVTDNVAVSSVFVEYWFGNGIHVNVSIYGLGPYIHEITIPSDSLATLYYTFYAFDGSGNRVEMSGQVTVLDSIAPVAYMVEDMEADEDGVVTLDGSGSTDNIGIANWTWTILVGTDEIPIYGSTAAYIFASPGIYLVTLELWDEAGNRGSNSFNIKVLDITVPVADAGSERTVEEGSLISLDGSGSSDNVGIVNWTWTFTVDGETVTIYGTNPSYTFSDPGEYLLTLRVLDLAGNPGEDGVTLTVAGITPPVADAGSDQTVNEGTIVILNGSGSSDNVGIVNWTWTFNDGKGSIILYGKVVEHEFEQQGNYTILLTVKDDTGNTATDEKNVIVWRSPDNDNVIDYWWFLLILIVILIVATVAFFFLRRKLDKTLEEPLTAINGYGSSGDAILSIGSDEAKNDISLAPEEPPIEEGLQEESSNESEPIPEEGIPTDPGSPSNGIYQ